MGLEVAVTLISKGLRMSVTATSRLVKEDER